MPIIITNSGVGYAQNIQTAQNITLQSLPTISTAPEILIYSAGGGTLFPNLPNDAVVEPGIYHNANPLIITDAFKTISRESLEITVEKKDVISPEVSTGLFDIEYPSSLATGVTADGKINYKWDEVYSTALGIYTHQGSASAWNFNLNLEIMQIEVNDVNIVPKIGDYIVFNYVPVWFTGYTNGDVSSKLPLMKGTQVFMAKIEDVAIVSGTGVDVLFQIRLDKSFNFSNGDRFAINLLNRHNTSIQKDLFYKTFETIEVHKKQLLGDPYNNQSDTTKPFGRYNYLSYNGHEGLGYLNLIKTLLNNVDTPVVVFDINDDIKDRFSFLDNSYDAHGIPEDIHFEFHLPGIMINDNVYVGSNSPVSASGEVMENIFVTSPNYYDDSNIGKYSGLYLKNDTSFNKRYGMVFYDLRIVVIDDPELATALGYNSDRNFTLPAPSFVAGSGNQISNPGISTNLNIIDASNTSPIVITTSAPFNLPRGAQVLITDVLGNTNANGAWYVDQVYGNNDIYRFELWQQIPQYSGSVRVSGSGIPVNGNGVFINNGVGFSGKVIGAKPAFSFFYTYRFRGLRNNAVAPYAAITNFNFTLSGAVDNSQGSLFVEIPSFNWYNQQNNLSSNDLGYGMIDPNTDSGYGIDIIIGEYLTNPYDPINPTKIIGIKNVMCIPIQELMQPLSGTPLVGLNFEVKRVQDYGRAVYETNNNINNYTFDLLNNMPMYNYNLNTLPDTLLTGGGIWTMGNFVYRKHVSVNRAKFNILVPVDRWNDSTNPTYQPSQNSFINSKYVTEVALLLEPDALGNESEYPVIYAKIAPAVKKNQDMDLHITLSLDW